MKRSGLVRVCAGAVGAAGVAAVAQAQVVLNSSQIQANSTALTGRGGSVAGPLADHDGPLGGTTGVVSAATFSTVGPVPPAQPPTPSLPGTTGVVTNRSRAGAIFSEVGGHHVVRAYASTLTDMMTLDGGTHQGFGDASFRVEFTLSASTPYAISGRFEPDDQDSLALVRIEGSGFLYFGPRGAYSASGVLGAGTYTLASGVTVYEVAGGGTEFREQGYITATLVLGSSAPVCAADLGRQGGLPGPDGVLDNNDFVVFIDYFFGQSPLADFGSQGGVDGPDGRWDNNDFIVFIDEFFAGCAG